jgi:ArsR family transcriptional regulator
LKNEYVYVFKALSHRSRVKLLELLAERGELSVGELTDAMPREGSTISRHLNQLHLHGLVQVRQDGQSRYYSLHPETLRDVFADVLREFKLGARKPTGKPTGKAAG